MRLTVAFLIIALFSELSLAVVTKSSSKKSVAKTSPAKSQAKAVAKVAPKAKAGTKVKAPAKAKTGTAAKAPAKAKTGTAAKAPAKAKTGTTTPPAKAATKPPVSKACALRPNNKKAAATKPTSAKTRTFSKRAIATTQFHATCKNSVPCLQKTLASGGQLQNPRIWPNEFTFSGGFYVTPKKEDAEMFGAIFLADKCKSAGGVSIMELTLDMSGLTPLEPGNAAEGLRFSIEQNKLGRAVRNSLGISGSTNTPADFPAAADIAAAVKKIEEDKDAAKVAFKGVSVKAAEQKSIIQRFKDFQGVDVVQSTTPVSAGQKALALDAKEIGMSPDFPVAAFTQVILVSDKAMSQLKVKAVTDLDPCLADLQKTLLAKQSAKLAAAEADGQILQAVPEGRC